MDIDRPDVVAEVAAAFGDYEKALVAGDAAALAGWFWDSPAVTRFGVADRQTGAAALHAWRSAQPAVPAGRRLYDTRICTFGSDLATVTTLFGYPDGSGEGRQSQTWVRLAEGWRIVHAHVSVV
ncbi:AtzH-like domain-containing protein [Dactylosporangium sp. CA-139114]|uniref:AtzH-like domain-containing protein n=1 Tax=Dactylosporangium sp. CA-139114 TaxID=3239931 RepID=UPI003D998026